jgi:predicted dehydrogenase
MSALRKVRAAIVGLGFGAEFIPIYQNHPEAELVALCRRDRTKLDAVADRFGVPRRYADYADLLADPDVELVHINSPIPDHGWMSIEALKAGKHVMCTVPMATTMAECRRIVELCRKTRRRYMMAETVIYSREFLYLRDLCANGELGRVQFVQASHQQDMDGWPAYWMGLPPMHYATHCVAPCLGLLRTEAQAVSCFGSGAIRSELVRHYRSPFAVESCHIAMRDSDLAARVYRSLFDTARQYRESFDVYGSKKSFEWPLVEGEPPVIHVAKRPEPGIPERVTVPDFDYRLPEPIRRFTTRGVYDDEHSHLSFKQGAGHGGSHPHLVHEMLSALREDRDPYPGPVESANITAVGILAHQSALAGGRVLRPPPWTLRPKRRPRLRASAKKAPAPRSIARRPRRQPPKRRS